MNFVYDIQLLYHKHVTLHRYVAKFTSYFTKVKFTMKKVANPLMNGISGYGQVKSSIANQIH
jgi:hypothetical protein